MTEQDNDPDEWLPLRSGDWEELVWLLIGALGGSCVFGWAGWWIITKVMP